VRASTESAKPSFQLHGVGHAYGEHEVLRGVDLDLAPGELVAVIGPNGVGKSTLLKLMLGFLPLQRGSIELGGHRLDKLTRRDIARLAAFVPQGYDAQFSLSVRQMVAMGRTPWLGRFRPEGEADRRAIDEAMRAADVTELAHRPLPELSGGERQRVLLARAFAQQTPTLVLDEPNASLDLRHAFDLLQLVRQRVREGAAAIAALHDLGLAARFCDRLIALGEGGIAAMGAPEQVLTPARIAEVFGVDAQVVRDDDGQLLVSVRGRSG
jgi:iron complex transport system ATP-binding protein